LVEPEARATRLPAVSTVVVFQEVVTPMPAPVAVQPTSASPRASLTASSWLAAEVAWVAGSAELEALVV
jgi:hypothetical protein